jgi:DNA-binding transcriptional LysR family regulator
MRLRHIEIFNAIMRTGSLSRAAELLHVSQPAVSKVLAHAEQQLGVMLFNRKHGGMTPTNEARALYVKTSAVQTELDRVHALARNLKLHPEGQLRVACLPSLGLSLIPQAVEIFHAKFPRVGLKIQTLHTEALLNAILVREIDLAIAIDPPAHADVTAHELGRSAIVCVGPPGDAKHGTPRSLDTFIENDSISLGASDPLGEAIANALDTLDRDSSSIVETHTWYIARALAARGVGHALLDELTARAPGEPVSIRPVEPALSVGVYALWHRDGHRSHAGSAFVEALQGIFS